MLNDGGEKQQEIVKLLLEHGANPHMTDKYGKTPAGAGARKRLPQNCRVADFGWSLTTGARLSLYYHGNLFGH